MTRVVSLISHLTTTSIPFEIAIATASQPGIDVTVAAFYDDTAPGTCNLSVVPLRANSRFDMNAFARLFELLRRDDVDILHTHDNFIGSVGRLLGTVAGVGIIDTEHRQHDSFTLLQNAVNIPTMSLADRVVANSEATKRSLLLLERLVITPEQLRVIYNGVNINRITSAISDRTVQDSTDRVRIITVGRLVEVKNQKTLLQAFTRLVETAPDARLALVGDGPLRNKLETQAESLSIREQVNFLGEIPREAVYQQLAASDIFVMPSLSEGFCVAAVEAMAMGLPVVVSDIDVFREVIGDSGVFVDPNNPRAFADEIGQLINQPEKREQLGKKAKNRACSKFSLEQTAREYSNLYKEVAETLNQ